MKNTSELGLAVALAVLCAAFAIFAPHFFTADNLLNVSLQASITAIIAAGMTFVILTAGIDLSVGSVVALSGIVATATLKAGFPLGVGFPLAIVAALLFGAASGGIAGTLVARFHVAPFIVTLALMTVWRGVSFLVTEGRPVWDLPAAFASLGSARPLGVPFPTLAMVGVFGVAQVVLTQTRFGRHVVACGGNPEAARLSGIRTGGVVASVYVLCGTLAAMSGVLLAARMNSGQPNAGLMYELDAIAAVVVGGTSLSGGRGTIVGTFLGAMLIAVLRNGLNLLDVSSYVQQVVVGVVILLAVFFDPVRRN